MWWKRTSTPCVVRASASRALARRVGAAAPRSMAASGRRAVRGGRPRNGICCAMMKAISCCNVCRTLDCSPSACLAVKRRACGRPRRERPTQKERPCSCSSRSSSSLLRQARAPPATDSASRATRTTRRAPRQIGLRASILLHAASGWGSASRRRSRCGSYKPLLKYRAARRRDRLPSPRQRSLALRSLMACVPSSRATRRTSRCPSS